MKRGATDAVMVSRGDAETRRVCPKGRGSFRAMRQVSSASWSETTIADALVKVKRPKSIPLSQYHSEGRYPVIDQGKNVVAGYTNDESAVIFSPLPITIFGDHTRIVKFSKVPFATGADGTQLLYPKSGINPTFFYYAIKNIDLSNYFYARHFKYLKASNIPLPSLSVQRRIADILSAYDDLIENNRRRIAILEETARLTYRKWFGGSEQFRTVTLGEIAPFVRGKVITQKNAAYGKVPVVAGGLDPAYFHNVANTGAPVITISGSGANAGFTRMYFEPIWASDCSWCDKSKTKCFYFAYCFLKDNADALRNLQQGAAQPHVYPKDINALEIVLPKSDDLLDNFEESVEPLFSQCGVLAKQNTALASARDMLLPRLMKGELV